MASVQKGSVIVIMGVSGSGKSTIGHMLAEVMECRFLDADDFHPTSNKEKMHKGIPLSEEDRIPWLKTLRDTLREHLLDGKTVVLGCSALQKHYREILRSADPNYRSGSFSSSVKFVLLNVEAKVLAARLQTRAAEGKHFMPPSLLQSQLELLQVDEVEGIWKVDASLSPQAIVGNIQALILQSKDVVKTNITESLPIDWEIVSEILLNKEAKKRASTVPLELLSTESARSLAILDSKSNGLLLEKTHFID